MELSMKILLTSMIVIGGLIGAANAAPPRWADQFASDETDYEYITLYDDNNSNMTDLKNSVTTLLPGSGDLVDAIIDGFNEKFNGANERIHNEFEAVNQRISNELGVVNARISSEFGLVDGKITALDDKVEKQSKELSGGIAAANALTGLDNHLDAGKKVGIGIGGGYYNSQAAVALGGVVRTGGNHALNAGVSFGTEGSVSAKAGWNLQF
jgi:autotransporter adhesin